MTDWFHQLKTGIEASGHHVRTWRAGDGELMLLNHGARLLACRLPDAQGNLFWHNPALLDSHTAAATLNAAGGSIGGDRLWLAPEIAYMWTDLAAARVDVSRSAVLEPGMDPADWRVHDEDADRVHLTAEMRLLDHRFKRAIELEVSREFAVIDRPSGLPDGIVCASFAIHNEARLVGGDDGAVAGTWDLLQLPATGTLICPTVTPVELPRRYYDPFGEKHVTSDGKSVRFLIDGKRRIKMGLLAEHVTGRMGYYRRHDAATASLVVRIFLPQPGEAYVDLPRDSEDVFGGDAIQAYNDDGRFGGFGEMEYHDPALIVGQGVKQRSGSCVTHVLFGRDQAVRQAGEALLGVGM